MPTLYNNLPVGEGIDLNISPTGYLIIEDVNRIDNTIRIKEPQQGANFQIDVYRTLEDTEVPLDTSAPSLYTVAAQISLGDPCPPGVPCGEAANKASIVRLPQQSLCCDDFDEEGVGPPTPVDPGGGGGVVGGKKRDVGGEVEPPVVPPEPPVVPDCYGDQEVGFFGNAGCGYPDSCVCVGHCIEFTWHDNGYLSSNHDNCCEPLCPCKKEQGGCGINFRTCSSITARVCYGYDGPGSYCCSGGYCYSNPLGSSAIYSPYTGCMWVCRLGSEFRFSDGAIRIGRCNCCPPCSIGEDPNGSACNCPLGGTVAIVGCTPSTLNCYPFVEPECNCGIRRTWKRRYTCCTHSSNECCCDEDNDNCNCTWTEKSADTCAIYLEMDYIGNLGPHGYWYNGYYYGNCRQRDYLDCCCYCQDPVPACCTAGGNAPDGELESGGYFG